MKLCVTTLAASMMVIAACSPADRAEMEKNKLESFELTPKQYEIAQALIEGYKKDTGMPMLRSRDYGRAACYAKTVSMPAMYERAHLLYLKNYTEADKDFYGYFARQGVGEHMAWEMSQKFQSAYDKCSTGALLKKRLGKN